jgi:hypothetical protein
MLEVVAILALVAGLLLLMLDMTTILSRANVLFEPLDASNFKK